MSSAIDGEKFLMWVFANREAIYAGEAFYEGRLVTPFSEAVRFETCLSMLILTMRKKSQCAATIVSLLFGWWAMPFGLIWTPMVISNNLWGGDKTTISHILEIGKNPEADEPSSTGNVAKVILFLMIGVIETVLILGALLKVYSLVRHMMG